MQSHLGDPKRRTVYLSSLLLAGAALVILPIDFADPYGSIGSTIACPPQGATGAADAITTTSAETTRAAENTATAAALWQQQQQQRHADGTCTYSAAHCNPAAAVGSRASTCTHVWWVHSSKQTCLLDKARSAAFCG